MRDGKLHIVGFGTGAVPKAVAMGGFVPLWKLANSDGQASYRMQIIVPSDSAIENASQLRGHELTCTDPGSNSGFKAPLVLLRNEFGLEPGRDYVIRYSGGHDESISGISKRTYEAAAVAGDVLMRAIAKNEIQQSQFRVIYSSEAFPTACFGCINTLKPELAKKLKARP